MTLEEAKNFYKQDKKEYILTSKFIIETWFKDIIEIEKNKFTNYKTAENYGRQVKEYFKNIIYTIKNIKDYQKIIDFIVTWYEIKYSDRFFDGKTNNDKIIKQLNSKQLLYALDEDLKELLKCEYRSDGWSALPVIINNKKISNESLFIILEIKEQYNGLDNRVFICINYDSKTGILNVKDILKAEKYINKKYIKKGYITIEELYNEVKNNKEINCTNIKDTILDRKLREKIRKEILELTSLKILYSGNTTPEMGYERAKVFINEMKKDFNIELTTDRIDEIMIRDYNYIKKLQIIK